MVEPKPEPTEEELRSEATNISEEFPDDESFSFITRGIGNSADFLQPDDYLEKLHRELLKIGGSRNITEDLLVPFSPYYDSLLLEGQPNTLDEVSAITSTYQQDGLSVGFLHGHFRIFTPNHWLTIAWACKHCDLLLIGLEDGFRTSLNKDLLTHFTEQERLLWLYRSGFNGHAFIIDKYLPYTDEAYEYILDMIHPNVYFIPDNEKFINRANRVGVKPIIRPERTGWSSSHFLNTRRNPISKHNFQIPY